jgi:leader peptidase (prepilin peptidase)/N-methyltransferase
MQPNAILKARSNNRHRLPLTIVFTFVVLWCALVGLAVGSFLNVVIWRVPVRTSEIPDTPDATSPPTGSVDPTSPDDATRKETLMWPRSYCPSCRTPILARDNIPVVSWLLLRGKCRACHARISMRYPAVELMNTLMWILVALVYWDRPELPAYLVLASGLVALSAIDIELKLLPRRIVYPLAGAELVLLGGAAVWNGEWSQYLAAVIGGLGAYAVIRFLFEVTRGRGIGYGDVRLSFVLGLALGWLGWWYILGGFFFGFLYGALVSVPLLAAQVINRRTPVPFGPFLAAGAMTFVLAGAPLLDWYLGTR